MKPHRTPLLANAVTGSVRTPTQGPVVPAAAYAAHTSSPRPDNSESDSDPRLTNTRPSTALRERLSQTRARIARAHAEHPPEIKLDWDAEEPLTRVYQGEKLPHARYTHADPPARHAHSSEPSRATQDEHPESAFASPHARSSDHTGDPWYSNLRAHATHAQHAHATPSDVAREPAAQGRATHSAQALEPSLANSSTRSARAERAQSRSFTRAHHSQAHRTRVRAEQALTARVPVPVATPTEAAPREFFLPPTAASALHERISTQRERLTQTLTSTLNTVRDQLGQLYTNVDRSDAALRKRVAYCSAGLLVVAAVSRIVFGGATSEAGASESSQAAATHQAATALQKASMSISSDPPGALISLDGQTGNQATPIKLSDLAPGRHTISLKLAGYAETKEAVNLPADALVSIKLASLSEPRFAPEPVQPRTTLSRAEQRAQARELARERRAAARAAKVLVRYRARMGLPPDPVAQELVDAYGPSASAE